MDTEIIASKFQKNLSVDQDELGIIVIEDAVELVSSVKKEVAKQKAIELCDNLQILLMPTDSIPVRVSSAAESDLADTFEIIEE